MGESLVKEKYKITFYQYWLFATLVVSGKAYFFLDSKLSFWLLLGSALVIGMLSFVRDRGRLKKAIDDTWIQYKKKDYEEVKEKIKILVVDMIHSPSVDGANLAYIEGVDENGKRKIFIKERDKNFIPIYSHKGEWVNFYIKNNVIERFEEVG